MSEWNAIVQALITSGTVAAAVGIVFKAYTEKRIEHVLDKKMKEYEAQLREWTELRIGFGKYRIEAYNKLSSLVLSARKCAVVLCENPSTDHIAALNYEIKKLQDIIYDRFIALYIDRIYERVHGYKVELVALVKNIENEMNLRNEEQNERADGVRGIITRSVADIQSECNIIVELLVEFVQKETTPTSLGVNRKNERL